ncbi:PH domain-containing protein [Pseudoalteromonas sp. SSDWG2]|uniref:PH domain-containing protein n=1 Tax=Pseudoalteromonas sp. SSDWG2 TaxID=3139391 RepID=UPI003BAD51DA
MGLLSGLMGNASEVNAQEIEALLEEILAPEENLEKAYKVIRDLFLFTNKRLILVDKQGVTGSKVEVLSIPYGKITKFSKESAGHFDMDAELKIWIGSDTSPLTKNFKRGDNINEVYRILSKFAL